MKIKSFEIFRYQLPLRKPISLKLNGNSSQREGLIIRLRSMSGLEGYGEIAPLPGFSQEKLDQALQQLSQLLPNLKNSILLDPDNWAEGSFQLWLNQFHLFQLFPSVRFGVESALLQLLTQAKNISLPEFLGSPNASAVPVIGLLQAIDLDAILKEAGAMLQNGFKTFKLKVTSSGQLKAKQINAVLSLIHRQAKLRLDCNQSLTVASALDLIKEIYKDRIEYIEEPFANALKDRALLPYFFRIGKIPVAVDESLSTVNPDQLTELPGLGFLILKPSILGGVISTLNWIKTAERLRLTPIISSGFESGIGLWVLTQLALVNRGRPAGIDTLKWFEEDLFKNSLEVKTGQVVVPPDLFNSSNINQDFLTSVSHG